MEDKTPEELGKAIISAQHAIHSVGAGWPLSSALSEFGKIMENWAQHPSDRNWYVIDRLEEFIKSIREKTINRR